MADEFGQKVRGLWIAGDTIVSTDGHLAALGKKGTDYAYLEIDSTSGALNVDIKASTTITVQATALDIRALTNADVVTVEQGTDPWVIGDGGASITVDASDLDIRDLAHTQDSIKVGDGTDFLAINSDGSINVNMAGTGADNTFHYGTANLVKDTATSVVSRAPSADEYFKSIIVSGAGLCEWAVKYGTTGSEATIAVFWTTPSCPTKHYDIPDSLVVSSGETLLIEGTNRERAASPGSDFAGHATLVRS